MCKYDYENETFNSDIARVIRKFDIYVCDLGEVGTNGDNIGKARPCVIVSSDDHNHPKNNMYVIAPIRTEHSVENITPEIAQEIVRDKEKLRRIYIPINMGNDGIRFIDITEQRKISSSQICRYLFSILNPKLKKQINLGLAKYLFKDEEIEEIFEDITKPKKETIIETNKSSSLPKGFAALYAEVKEGILSSENAANKLGISVDSFDFISKEFSKNSKSDNNVCTNSKQQIIGTYYNDFISKKLTANEIAEYTDINKATVYYYLKKIKEGQKAVK